MAERPAPAATVAWFHCFAGIAGDMALGALLDAGADLDEVRAILDGLPLTGWSLTAEPAMRGGIAATRAVVGAEPTRVVRTYAAIDALLDQAELPERVRARAGATFAAIAAVEARLHRRPVEQVHFHEVGGIDAIVDIVGVAAALEVLGVEAVQASPVANGLGMVRTAHGLLPNPSPAVVELLAGAPTHGVDVPVELTTPTGAGLLAALAEGWGPMPAMTVAASGFGAGSRELEAFPNLTQVVVGQPARPATSQREPVVLVETNLDDVTGETLASTVALLLDAGAHDAWVTPIVMKKGRPAHMVSVLADPARAPGLVAVLARQTGTLGVRTTTLERWTGPRTVEQVEVEGHPVRVKVGAHRAKAEHDDVTRVARDLGLPVAEVAVRAEEVWRRHAAAQAVGGDEAVVELPDAAEPPPPRGGAG